MKPIRAVKRILARRRGTAAIEFAFVLVPLMVLMFGAIEVARLVWVQNAIQEIAISGARCMGIRAFECADASGVNDLLTKEHIRGLARSWGLSIASDDIDLNAETGCSQASFSGVVIDYRFISVLTVLGNPNLLFEACFPNQV